MFKNVSAYFLLFQARGFDLFEAGITVYNEDVCNIDFLEDIFNQYNFTHVAHLAAQAGVRYSLQNPQAYIHSNVECQLALMTVLKNRPVSSVISSFGLLLLSQQKYISYILFSNK